MPNRAFPVVASQFGGTVGPSIVVHVSAEHTLHRLRVCVLIESDRAFLDILFRAFLQDCLRSSRSSHPFPSLSRVMVQVMYAIQN